MNRSLRGRPSFPATLLSLGLAFGGGCADTSQPQPSVSKPKVTAAISAARAPATLAIPADARPMILERQSSPTLLDVSPAGGIEASPAAAHPSASIRGIAPTVEASARAVREPTASVEVAQRLPYPSTGEATDEGPELTSAAPTTAAAEQGWQVVDTAADGIAPRGGAYQAVAPYPNDEAASPAPYQPLYEAVSSAPVPKSPDTAPTSPNVPSFTPAEIPIEPKQPLPNDRAKAKTPNLPAQAATDPRPAWRLEDPALQTAPPAQSLVGNAVGSPRTPMNDAARRAVANRASELVGHAYTLAQRGAHYSARAELIQALRLVAQTNDAAQPNGEHSQALARGLQALREADDFAPRGSRLEGQLDVAQIVVAHRTPVLKHESLEVVSPLVALQRYYSYSQQQFAVAGGNMPAASQALYGLGRIQTLLADGTSESQRLQSPKAMTYYQSALLVDSGNYLAANELGVMLAGYGQLQDARRVLLHSVTTRPHVEGWQNLAIVHAQLGEQDLAHRADYERQLLVAKRSGSGSGSPLENAVQWVSPETFASGGAVDTMHPAPLATATRPSSTPDAKNSGNLQR